MKIKLDIEASDAEPGCVLFTVAVDGNSVVIPLKGAPLLQFAECFAKAYNKSFCDTLAANGNPKAAREAETILTNLVKQAGE